MIEVTINSNARIPTLSVGLIPVGYFLGAWKGGSDELYIKIFSPEPEKCMIINVRDPYEVYIRDANDIIFNYKPVNRIHIEVRG